MDRWRIFILFGKCYFSKLILKEYFKKWYFVYVMKFLDFFWLVVFFLFNKGVRGRDFGKSSLLGRFRNVCVVLGLLGWLGGFIKLLGIWISYIYFFNRWGGVFDIFYFMMVLLWVYLEGIVGFLFNYYFSVCGVYFWLSILRILYVRFMCWKGRKYIMFVKRRVI